MIAVYEVEFLAFAHSGRAWLNGTYEARYRDVVGVFTFTAVRGQCRRVMGGDRRSSRELPTKILGASGRCICICIFAPALPPDHTKPLTTCNKPAPKVIRAAHSWSQSAKLHNVDFVDTPRRIRAIAHHACTTFQTMGPSYSSSQACTKPCRKDTARGTKPRSRACRITSCRGNRIHTKARKEAQEAKERR
jgi:hypothetical protein